MLSTVYYSCNDHRVSRTQPKLCFLTTINPANTDTADGARKSACTKGVSRIKRVESEKM